MIKIKLTTLSPVHVGNGIFLNSNTDYAYQGGEIFIVEEKKLFEKIPSILLDKWVRSIEQNENLTKFMQGEKLQFPLEDIAKRVLTTKLSNSEIVNFLNLKEQLHDGRGIPYIPGSSIKGSIRSALYNHLIISKKTRITTDELKLFNKYTSKALEAELFGNDPNHSIFRFLRFGDAYFKEGITKALVIENINMKGNPENPNIILDSSKKQLTEVFGSKETCEIDMQIDKTSMLRSSEYKYISSFPEFFSDLNQLFSVVNQNTIQLLEDEYMFWGNYNSDIADKYCERINKMQGLANNCNENECIIRLAHGTGWNFIAGNWLLSDNMIDDENYENIVEIARPGNKRYKEYPFPKSRRVTSKMNLMGFVHLKVIPS